jgi:uncharacterized surface protein with fasciclin (FAS1) repeats
MKTSLKLILVSLSALGFGLGTTLPSVAQSKFTPNAETTPANTPQSPPPTNRDTGIPPIQSTPEGQNNNNNQNNNLPGTVSPANRPTETNTPNNSFSSSADQSIDEIVRTNPSFELFNALLRVAESRGILAGQLAGSSDYTVFAPTDEALAAIPAATFKALVQPENEDLLAQLLENHIVRGKVSSSDLAAKQVRALSGNPVAAQGGAGSLTIGNARVVGADIQADNGIIHVVDQAILPADLQSKLTSFAR